jgi:CRP-like cAMP-binding protein
MKQKDSQVKVRRPQQNTMVKSTLKGIDVKAVKDSLIKQEAPQPYLNKKDEPEDIELKSLTPLSKDGVDENELFLLKEAFSRHFLLGNISLNAIDSIMKEMDYFELAADKTLFDQGDTGMHLFILTKGVLEVKVDNTVINVIHEGSAFGEIALIYSCKRTAQIINKSEECHLWTIHRKTFHTIMKGISDQTSFIRTNIVRELRVFSFIDRELRSKLSEYMIPMKFNKGDCIIRKGIQEILYVISRGTVRRQSSNNAKIQSNKVFKKGRILGFSTMINESSLQDSYICDTDVD